MQCPVDSTTLAISDRQGVEIDYCPKCRGVWLDRGELDKLIERNTEFDTQRPAPMTTPAPQPQQQYDNYERRDERRSYDHDSDSEHHDNDRGQQKKKKKESFLGDLFDF